MRRNFILEGDKTPTGGVVQEGHPAHSFYGRRTSFDGARIDCPACKSTGVIRCIPSMRPFVLPNGHQVALEGDLCICKCLPPPKLIASQVLAGMEFEGNELLPISPRPSPQARDLGRTGPPMDRAACRSVRFQAIDAETGQPLRSRRYVLTRENGFEDAGLTDELGYSEIVEVDEPERIAVHFVFADANGNAIDRKELLP